MSWEDVVNKIEKEMGSGSGRRNTLYDWAQAASSLEKSSMLFLKYIEDEEDLEEEALKGLAKGLFGKKEKEGKEEGNIILSITTEVTEVKAGKINDSEFELSPNLKKETKK